MSGRIGEFEAIITDNPGSLSAVTGILASQRANILDVVHDRLAAGVPFGKTRVIFTVEIRGKNHLDHILSALRAQGYEAQERGGVR